MTLEMGLRALMDKYESMLVLRRSRDALEARGVFRLHGAEGAARRAEAKRLAQRFPGALRELEHLSTAALQTRLGDLQHELHAALQHPRRRRPQRRWIRVVLDYHAALHEGLAIRRWLVAHRAEVWSEAELVQAFVTWYQHSAARRQPVQRVNAAWLRRYARPPEGRLTELVRQDLAARYRCQVQTLRRWLWE